jgi:ribosomal protein S27E
VWTSQTAGREPEKEEEQLPYSSMMRCPSCWFIQQVRRDPHEEKRVSCKKCGKRVVLAAGPETEYASDLNAVHADDHLLPSAEVESEMEKEAQAQSVKQAERARRIAEAEKRAEQIAESTGLIQISDLDLDRLEVYNALKRAGITRVAQLVARNRNDLKGLGIHHILIDRIEAAIRPFGLSLSEDEGVRPAP